MNFVNDTGLNDGFGNQIVLPRNEGLLLTDRRVPVSKTAQDMEKRSKSFGEFDDFSINTLFIDH